MSLFYTYEPKITIKWSMLYHHLTYVYQKSQSYDVRFLRYGVRQTEFFVVLGLFFPFYPTNNLEKSKFGKNEKDTSRYFWFTLVHHKWQSYDAWFLRHRAQQTECLVILGYFLPFYFPNNPKNQNLKWKKHLEISSFYTCLP